MATPTHRSNFAANGTVASAVDSAAGRATPERRAPAAMGVIAIRTRQAGSSQPGGPG